MTAGELLAGLEWVVLVYFVVSNGFQTLLLVAACIGMARHRRTVWNAHIQRLLGSAATPRVSVLAPAFNEAATIADSVRAMLTLSYPDLEVVVINDGSTDDTLAMLKSRFDLVEVHQSIRRQAETAAVRGTYHSQRHRGLVVVDKVHGGKADSLNAGLNVASGELVCAIDADTLIEPDAFLRIIRPFLEHESTVAAGATIRVANGTTVRDGRVVQARVPHRALPGIQTVEYLRSFLFGRLGWNLLGGNLIVSGAFGMFRRSAMLDSGGYRHDTVGEDMEIVVRLRRHGVETGGPTRVTFVPDPIAWTEVPESLRALGRQRDRWQRGLADVLWRHRRLVLNPRYRWLGVVAMPYYVVVELIGPLLEAVGLIGLVGGLAAGVVNGPFALLFFLAAYGWGLILSLTALLLHQCTADEPYPLRDVPTLLSWVLLESLGYRQLTVLWRLRGFARYLRGATDWGSMARTGFGRPPV
jgi:cellulose synthase/poly-beta-1,6-N-acetylglucosamine synthase-like glycosyltransferase